MKKFLILMGLALTALASVAGEPGYQETVSVGYVMIPFTVLGANGTPLTGLTADDVSLYVDGSRVSTDLFEKAVNAPVSFTILVDASGSMALGEKMEAARAAVSMLLNQRRPDDEFALYSFTEGDLNELVPFTSDGDRVRRAMSEIRPFGKTAFFDALAKMPETGALGSNPTKAVILLSDGIDNASNHTRASLSRIFAGSSIPIYPLGLRRPMGPSDSATPKEGLSDIEILELVAGFSGGKLQLGTRPEQLEAAVQAVQKELRTQYFVGFAPTGRGAIRYRRISLKLEKKTGTVRVRAGYRGTEPPAVVTAVSRKSR